MDSRCMHCGSANRNSRRALLYFTLVGVNLCYTHKDIHKYYIHTYLHICIYIYTNLHPNLIIAFLPCSLPLIWAILDMEANLRISKNHYTRFKPHYKNPIVFHFKLNIQWCGYYHLPQPLWTCHPRLVCLPSSWLKHGYIVTNIIVHSYRHNLT